MKEAYFFLCSFFFFHFCLAQCSVSVNDLNSFSIFSGGSIYINQKPGVYILEISDQYNSQLVRKITIQ